jgi:hypothetical protein
MGTQYEGKRSPSRPKVRLSNAGDLAIDQMIDLMLAGAKEPKDMREVLKSKFGDRRRGLDECSTLTNRPRSSRR